MSCERSDDSGEVTLQICIEGRPIASKIGAKSAFWSVEGEAVKVEDLALQHYAAEEHGSWQGAPQPVQSPPVLVLAKDPLQDQRWSCTPA